MASSSPSRVKSSAIVQAYDTWVEVWSELAWTPILRPFFQALHRKPASRGGPGSGLLACGARGAPGYSAEVRIPW